jgi:8-oxo-dGTP pyrophosphatase MutT (NUDIX family)
MESHGDVAPASEVPTPFYRVSVKAIVFDAEDRLLVVQERAGHWELPGGGWEHGETLEQCVRREFREELGASLGPIDLSSQRAWTGQSAHRCYHRLKLTVRATLDPTAMAPRDEILAARWVMPVEFGTLTIAAGDGPLREHVLAIWPGRDVRA